MDNTDKHACLCCGQTIGAASPRWSRRPHEANWELLEALGYTREALLTKHRAQLDFQLPGLAEWLQGQ